MLMGMAPHKDKLSAALENPKCRDDKKLLMKATEIYEQWITSLTGLRSNGKKRVIDMVDLLNDYKNTLEVELIMKNGSALLKRQKGQLKLDNTIIEEFLVHLVQPSILNGLEAIDSLQIGPKKAFMSLAFFPRSLKDLVKEPKVVVKTKDQDFVVGTQIHYKLSTSADFAHDTTTSGDMTLAVLAAECKANLDKTMFQEAAGTAARLKQGCPVARYYVLVEYLDMIPEDCRLTSIDNVFLLRHARRLPFEKRSVIEEVEKQHLEFPIDAEVVWRFVQEIQEFIDAIWYDPDEALKRGSFV